MSENVDVVMEAFRNFEANDFDSDYDHWHPQSRLTVPEGWPEPGPFEGRDAVFQQFRRLASDLGEHHPREVEIVADRAGWVVVSFIWEVRGAGSGASTASKLAAAYLIEDGRIMEAHFRWTSEEALEASGLMSTS
jgi:ketosteroid isomerase-like protein